MVNAERLRRKQLIREAEGYLDLLSVFEDRWKLEPDLAEKLAQRVLDTLAKITNPQGFQAEILFLKGQTLRSINRLPEATTCLEQAQRLNPENIHIILALAWCYKRVARIGQAIEAMRTALQIDSESAICHYNLACYLGLDNQAKEAAHHLAIALEIHPDYRLLVHRESDFDLIRDTREFQTALTAKV